MWAHASDGGIVEQRASDLAYVTGLYDLPDPNPNWLGDSIDLWGYEAGLPKALEALRDHRVIDARLWIHNLVPFVAGLFSRGPDANNGENNEGRVIQFQEQLAPVMAANWIVLHFPEASLPTSDRALGPARVGALTGYLVPVDPSSALLLTRGISRQIASYKKGRWYVRVPHRNVTDTDLKTVRESLAKFALSSIYGPSRESVGAVPTKHIGTANRVWPSLLVSEKDCDLICHVYDYFRVASAIARPPADAQGAADRIDLTSVSSNWTLPIAHVGLRPERTRGGVIVDGDAITQDLRLGIAIKRLRMEHGEAIRGAYAVFPIQHFLSSGHRIGDDCISDADGRADRTYVRDERMSTVRRIDLPPRGRSLPELPAFARRLRTRRGVQGGRRPGRRNGG